MLDSSTLNSGEPTVCRNLSIIVLIIAIALITIPAWADDEVMFDAQLANELGADQYGMRAYVMAFLKSGPNPSENADRAAELQQGHMAHIRSMAEQGHLVMAGPFMDAGSVRGIFIFATDSMEQARAWTEADPAIQAGALEMELRPWYGSAALVQLNEVHEKIARINP